MEEKLTEN